MRPPRVRRHRLAAFASLAGFRMGDGGACGVFPMQIQLGTAANRAAPAEAEATAAERWRASIGRSGRDRHDLNPRRDIPNVVGIGGVPGNPSANAAAISRRRRQWTEDAKRLWTGWKPRRQPGNSGGSGNLAGPPPLSPAPPSGNGRMAGRDCDDPGNGGTNLPREQNPHPLSRRRRRTPADKPGRPSRLSSKGNRWPRPGHRRRPRAIGRAQAVQDRLGHSPNPYAYSRIPVPMAFIPDAQPVTAAPTIKTSKVNAGTFTTPLAS